MFSHNKNRKIFLSSLAAVIGVLSVFALSHGSVFARGNTVPVGHLQLSHINFSIPIGDASAQYVTPDSTPDFGFNALAVQWTGTIQNEEDAQFELFVRDTHGSVQRRVLENISDDSKGPLPVDTHVSQPVIVKDVQSFWVVITLNRSADGSSPIITDVDFTYLDTTRPTADAPKPLTGVEAARAAEEITSSLSVISREEWGADESLRNDADGNELWERQYQDPEVFIVHHTAGTDGGDDPAATIRAIYYYHAVVLGWGDIGYNYLIDPAGNIYHGRKGGDGVIGGHTYNSTDDVNFNPGSVGIALLGCFESTPGACYTKTAVSEATVSALEQLIGVKAAQFGIDPTDETTFHDRTVTRVIGHRDVDYTFCPGSDMEANIPDVRNAAHTIFETETAKLFEGNFASSANISLSRTVLPTVTVQYTNTGANTWTQDQLYLKIYRKTGKKPTNLRDESWPDALGKIQMTETSVAPGETATFTFSIHIPDGASTRKILTKLFSSTTKVKKTNTKITFAFTDGTRSATAQ